MKFLACIICLLGAWLLGGCAGKSSSQSNSREALFNDGWRFQKEAAPIADPAALPAAGWRDVQLPHDWSIEGPFSQEWASGQGFLPGGIGWYRKSFELPASAAGKSIAIRFDGVYKRSQVWCNGKLAGGRPFGYISFTLDLTPLVHPGQNEIVVKVDHSDFADSRWYTGSGIFRNVFLVTTDKLRVAPYGTFVSTPAATEDAATIDIQTTLKNDGVDAAVVLASTLFDPQGNQVGAMQTIQNVAQGAGATVAHQLTLRKPALWSPETPALYRLRTDVFSSGRLVDSYDTPFGVRTFKFDAAAGFALNGQPTKFKGVCLHEDAGALGAAIPIEVWRRRFSLLKEMGCNAIRTSHNPPAPEFLDLCDQMGFLVMDEAFDEWTGAKNKWVAGRNQGQASRAGYAADFNQWADIDVRDMVLRDRNHPSIVMWSIGNEIDYVNDPFPQNSQELLRVAGRLIKAVKAVDNTRPVTAACAAVGSNLFVDLLDIAGYNYQEQRYAGDHAQNPKRIIYGSENSHAPNLWTSSVMQNNFVAGQFLWTGIDYLGEAGAWPNRGSGAGNLDLAGFKKPRFYQRQALWTDKPMVYINPAANGVTCYSNCETVALYHDGTLISETPVNANKQVNAAFVLSAGTLKAVGRNAGKEVCTHEVRAPGAARKIVVIPDVKTLAPGGVAQIEVNIADADGTRVPSAAHQVDCEVTGARLLGIENGSQASHENYQAPTHRVNQGRMLIYLRAERPGPITLSLHAAGLEPARLELISK
jgi:beta-galactosidase/beta-glucuronidase